MPLRSCSRRACAIICNWFLTRWCNLAHEHRVHRQVGVLDGQRGLNRQRRQQLNLTRAKRVRCAHGS